ncbi:MAG: chalcone isomerase family protein [bacterium]|nr:chalcone isomerase family protein [bacterium]
MLVVPVALPLARLLLAMCLALAAAPAAARDVAGVAVADTTDVAGQTLHLSGAGVRTRWFFEVYVAALYLPHPAHTAAEVLDGAGPRRVRLHMLRALGASRIAEAVSEAFARNAGDALPALQSRLTRLESLFPAAEVGDRIDLTVAGGHTEVAVNDVRRGTIEGADFGRALLAVWLGPDPVDADLKRALLGG